MKNVKTAPMWMCFAALIASLIHGPAPLRAQPTTAPINEPAPSTTSEPTEKVAPPPTAEPAAEPTVDSMTEPAADDSTDPTVAVTNEDDKPWSRGVSVENRQTARELFLQGNRLFRVPLFARAAEQYTAALEKWKHPAFYFNLALAQINLSQEIEARENLELALQHGEEPLGVDEFREAQKQLREVERRLGRIRIVCQTRGAKVTMDGVMLFTGPGSHEGWVKAGTHDLMAQRAGYLAERKQVMISSGLLQGVELEPITLEEAAENNRRWAKWKPWLVVASGAAVAAGGGVLHVLSARNFDAYDEAFLKLPCATAEESSGCNQDDVAPLSSRLSKARRQRSIALGSYAVGGALLATGAALLYLNRPRLPEQEFTQPSAGRAVIVPELSSDMFGVVLSVSH